MSFFKKLLPVLAGLGVGLAAPEILPLIGLGGAGGAAAGGAAAAGSGAGAAAGATEAATAAGAAIPTAAIAPVSITPAATSAASSATSAPFLERAAGYLGNHPSATIAGTQALFGNNQQPAPTPGLAPSGPPVMRPQQPFQRLGSGPQDLGFQQALIGNLRRN